MDKYYIEVIFSLSKLIVMITPLNHKLVSKSNIKSSKKLERNGKLCK